VRALLPWSGRGLEIGVGSGRFAAPLGVEFGIDPAAEMLAYARARGVRVACAVAEALPFADAAFDYALVVTTICFVDDAAAMLAEARRVLKPGGELVIGFIDRTSDLGRHYLAHREENVFYRDARFYSATRWSACSTMRASATRLGADPHQAAGGDPRDRADARRTRPGLLRGRQGGRP
jgi:SAM-dependent methyltransferase